MAVLHHAFRRPFTADFEAEVACVFAAWESGDLARLSAISLDGYAKLAEREEVHRAFLFDPEGSATSWMQPDFISTGLAALAVLAGGMVEVPNLSASGDTNHYLLETHLPQLGWSAADIALLVHGRPIEAMLQSYVSSVRPIEQGGFRHTGGWTTGQTAQAMKARIDRLVAGPPDGSDESAVTAWRLLADSGALADAHAMLAAIGESDWLVMAVTH